jgi:hypothetical protein
VTALELEIPVTVAEFVAAFTSDREIVSERPVTGVPSDASWIWTATEEPAPNWVLVRGAFTWASAGCVVKTNTQLFLCWQFDAVA